MNRFTIFFVTCCFFLKGVLFASSPDILPAINQVIVVKETRAGEGRVALTPEGVSALIAEKYQVWVEVSAGVKAGFTDEDYLQVGAKIFTLTEDGFPKDSLILRVKRPSKEREIIENECYHANTCIIGFLTPFIAPNNLPAWQKSGVTTLSLELCKTLPQNDAKNALAAMSQITGQVAFKDALSRYKGKKALRLTVLGTGPAAYSAALAARDMKIPVQMFGRKEKFREALEKEGISYYVVPDEASQVEFIRSHLEEETLLIAAARTPGKKAPLLIDDKSLVVLPENAVVIDLTASQGGNVQGSKLDQVVSWKNGILIVNDSGYPKAVPREASEAYSTCMVNLIREIFSPNRDLLMENNLVGEIWITHKGACNPLLLEELKKCSP